MGFLGDHFKLEGGKIAPCVKLVGILVEIWNLLSAHAYVVLENIAFIGKVILILPMSAFFQKFSNFSKNIFFTQSNSVRALLEIF